MATAIGPGTRVWCGFCAEGECTQGTEWARGRTGTVVRLHESVVGAIASARGITFWDVQIDGAHEVGVREDMLHPIDDGDPAQDDQPIERPTEVVTEEV